MRRLRLAIDRLELQWDRDSGIYKRGGWSVCYDGRFLVELEPRLIVALMKARRMWRRRGVVITSPRLLRAHRRV